jgi:type IV secretory pathway VirB3-like protein
MDGRRESRFHPSLNRPKLFLGVPLNAFLLIVLGGSFAFVARIYWIVPGAFLLWLIAKWLTKRDSAWMDILEHYLKEEHVYDSVPRAKEYKRRPEGWGRGLPW